MKEDERILNAITPIVNARKTHKDDNLYSLQLNSYQLDMLQGLLDLYIAEKEKNKKIEDKIKVKLEKSKVKEKIKELEKLQENNKKDLEKYINVFNFHKIDEISNKIMENYRIRTTLQELLEEGE